MLCGYRQFHSILKRDDIYEDVAKDIKNKFGTSNYELDRPLPNVENRKINWINKK